MKPPDSSKVDCGSLVFPIKVTASLVAPPGADSGIEWDTGAYGVVDVYLASVEGTTLNYVVVPRA